MAAHQKNMQVVTQALMRIRELAHKSQLSCGSTVLSEIEEIANQAVQQKNWQVFRQALMRIRLSARQGKSSVDASAQTPLKEIEEIADRLHNVPSMLLNGTPCDAAGLLNDGSSRHWPTGISAEGLTS